MADRQRKNKGGRLPENMQYLMRMMSIPAVVLVLILVIVLADRMSSKPEETTAAVTTESEAVTLAETAPSETESGAETTESVEETSESETAAEYASLDKDAIPEIRTLMEEYCSARARSDAETLYRLYGRTDTDGIEQERAKMQYNARYIDNFQNIVCYTTQGLDENSWLVYTSADIKFRAAATLAPTVMWCYVTKNDEGTYLIADTDTLGDDVRELVEKTNFTADVRSLARQANQRLQEAVASDPDLATVYGTLNAGSPLWQETEASVTEEAVVLIDGMETTEESTGETTAETQAVSVETEGGEAAGEQSE